MNIEHRTLLVHEVHGYTGVWYTVYSTSATVFCHCPLTIVIFDPLAHEQPCSPPVMLMKNLRWRLLSMYHLPTVSWILSVHLIHVTYFCL